MQILKVFLKTIKVQLNSILLYLGIFITINILVAQSGLETVAIAKDAVLKVVILDEDQTEASRTLIDYIQAKHTLITPKRTDDQYLQDALYYQQIDYVLTIPSGFETKLRNMETTEDLIQYAVDPKGYNSQYLNADLRGYFTAVHAYQLTGSSLTDAMEKASDLYQQDIPMENLSAKEASTEYTPDLKFYNVIRYAAYAIPGMLICTLSRIIISLRKKDIRNRTNCSPVSPTKVMTGIILGSVILSVSIWLLISVVSVIFCKGVSLTATSTLLSLLNCFIFTMICSGIAILISIIFQNDSLIIDMISNIICLGMAFLCGVFVPLYILSDTVITISRFLPAYWYISVLNNMYEINGEILSYSYIFKCMGIELLFIAALFACCYAIAKVNRKEA